MEETVKWIAALGGAFGAALSIWNWFQSPAKKNADELASVRSALDDTKARVASLEAHVGQLPDKDSFHRLEIMIANMGGDLKAMNESMKAVRDISVMAREMISKEVA